MPYDDEATLEDRVAMAALRSVMKQRAHWWTAGGIDGYVRLHSFVFYCLRHCFGVLMDGADYDRTTRAAVDAMIKNRRPPPPDTTDAELSSATSAAMALVMARRSGKSYVGKINALYVGMLSGELLALLGRLAKLHDPRRTPRARFDNLFAGRRVWPKHGPFIPGRTVGFHPALAAPYGRARRAGKADRLPHTSQWLPSHQRAAKPVRIKVVPSCPGGKHDGPFGYDIPPEQGGVLTCYGCGTLLADWPSKEAS